MNILGIESSCDDTAIAVLDENMRVKTSLVSSQVDLHAEFGGVVPEIAARQHLQVIRALYKAALRKADISSKEIDLITVSQGPGLIGALRVGTSFAKGLAASLSKPLVPVSHVHAHVYGALLGLDQDAVKNDVFPCLALVISGGHSNVYYMSGPLSFRLLFTTIDDACGECFDKVARLLGLPYPGGPYIEKAALGGRADAFKMPKMMSDSSRLALSYSGLKTHIYYLLQKLDFKNDPQVLSDVCASFQLEAFSQIVRKLEKILPNYPDLKSVLVAGGVSANKTFRSLLQDNLPLTIHFPGLQYCADNAAMIAAYGHSVYNMDKIKFDNDVEHNWEAYSRYDNERL